MHVDFTSQDFLRDPAAGIARLRRAGPVVEVKFPIVGRTWITTTHELAARVLKDSETFTIRRRAAGLPVLRWWMPRIPARASQQHAGDRRARAHAAQEHRRRSLPPPRRPRHGAAHPRAIAEELADDLFARGQSRRPGGALRAHAAAFRHVRAARSADGRPGPSSWAGPANMSRLRGPMSFLRLTLGLAAMKRYLEERLRDRAQGRRRRADRRARPHREAGRPDHAAGDGGDGVPAARRGIGDDDAPDQRVGLRAAEQSAVCATGWRRTGAAPTWASRSSCASSRRCSSPSRASCAGTWSSTAFS